MRILPFAFCLALACASAPEPSDHDAGTTVDAGEVASGPVDAREYCEEIAPFFCRFYLRCNRIAAGDQASCLSVFAESCEARYEPRYAGLADTNLIELRREGLAACEAHLDTVACEEQRFDLDGPCADVWRGTQGEGNACGFDLESFTCSPGTRCVLGLNLCGTCVRVASGEETCGGGFATCAASASCVEGRCVERAGLGEACEGFGDCAPGLSCVDDLCAGPERASVGEPCDQARRCPFAATCVQGVCVAQARAGEPCDTAVGCVAGRCVSGRCEALLGSGEPCESSLACVSGLCREGRCEPVPGRCFVTE